MEIKINCINCNFGVEISKEKLKSIGFTLKYCPQCGTKLEISNLEEIIEQTTYKTVQNYLKDWFNTLGVEGTIEMLYRNIEQPTAHFYISELKKRGLWHEKT